MSNEPQESPSVLMSVLPIVTVVSTFIFVGWLLWLFFQFACSQPLPAIVALTVIFTVWAGVSSRQFAADRRAQTAAEAERRKRRVKVYEQFLTAWLDHITRPKSGESVPSSAEQSDRLSRLHSQILLWASDAVIQEYLRFRRMVSLSEETVALEIFPALEKLVIAMRKDLGNNGDTQRLGDLLRQFAEDSRHA